MTDELVTRLHLPWPKDESVEEVTLPVWVLELTGEAAARIEADAATIARLEREKRFWSGEYDTVLAGRAAEYDRAEAAEAKLAQAVEVLRGVRRYGVITHSARAFLDNVNAVDDKKNV